MEEGTREVEAGYRDDGPGRREPARASPTSRSARPSWPRTSRGDAGAGAGRRDVGPGRAVHRGGGAPRPSRGCSRPARRWTSWRGSPRSSPPASPASSWRPRASRGPESCSKTSQDAGRPGQRVHPQHLPDGGLGHRGHRRGGSPPLGRRRAASSGIARSPRGGRPPAQGRGRASRLPGRLRGGAGDGGACSRSSRGSPPRSRAARIEVLDRRGGHGQAHARDDRRRWPGGRGGRLRLRARHPELFSGSPRARAGARPCRQAARSCALSRAPPAPSRAAVQRTPWRSSEPRRADARRDSACVSEALSPGAPARPRSARGPSRGEPRTGSCASSSASSPSTPSRCRTSPPRRRSTST